MKNFKNIFTILLLCAISTVHAKRTGGTQAPVAQPTQPVYTPQPQIQPKPQVQPQIKPNQQPYSAEATKGKQQTFQQLVNYVKTARSNDVWDNANKLLKDNFVADLIQKAKNAGLNEDQLDILLIIARDFHAQFTGNNDQDATILTKLEQQREITLNTFNKIGF